MVQAIKIILKFMDSQKQLGNNLAKTQNKKARSKAVKPIKFPSIALLRVGKY
jgi:hypothetical protein